MLPWVQVYTNICDHPKTLNLAETLGIKSSATEPETIAVGMLIGLWTWAAVNAYDGNLSGVSDRAIARACGWRKEPKRLVDALVACGWVDSDMKIHDWEEYAELYINRMEYRKEQNRRRVKECRDRKKAESVKNNAV